jgi:hypothetical protein
MKHKLIRRALLFSFATTVLAAVACTKTSSGNESYDDGVLNTSTLRLQLQNSIAMVLDQKEIESLLYMREEEKMARDVYLSLGKKWNTRIFDNISSAEQTHMDAMLLLLNKYGIQDPVGNNAIGVFINQKLQALYNQLVLQGEQSSFEAFKTGATIEDLDIYDFNNALSFVHSLDIKMVYGNLVRASGNHLRAFYRNILRSGGVYVPQYISQSDFDSIINS